jgi:membrane-associated phospholipid phosphatase
MRRKLLPFSAALLGVLLSGGRALGEHGDDRFVKVEWSEEWPLFRAWEYVATGVALASGAAFELFVAHRDTGDPWRNALDDGARDLLRAQSRAGRDRARTVGDLGYRVLGIYPFVDTLLVGGLVHGSGGVALQSSLLNLESFSFAGVFALGSEHVFGRSRPSAAECARDAEYEEFCGLPDQYGSFIGGHTTAAFVGAGLTCAHHQSLPLYGGGAADTAACVLATTLATTTFVARIVNDRHWATDNIVGAAIGGLSGYALPMVLHYGVSNVSPARNELRWTVRPFASYETRTIGLQWVAE